MHANIRTFDPEEDEVEVAEPHSLYETLYKSEGTLTEGIKRKMGVTERLE